MITFKQFLTERKRTDAEAIKLGSYIAGRNKGRIPFKNYTFPNEVRKVVLGGPAMLKSLVKKPKQAWVDTKNLIPTQAGTKFKKEMAIQKFNNNDPIDVLLHRGKQYILNGHHRYREATLKGHPKILANLHSLT